MYCVLLGSGAGAARFLTGTLAGLALAGSCGFLAGALAGLTFFRGSAAAAGFGTLCNGCWLSGAG